jgi:hypothetical protein
MGKDIEQALVGKSPEIPGELGKALSKHNDPEKARYFGQFHKTSYVSLESLQTFRMVVAIIINTPIWLVAIMIQGMDYFVMYATQWTAFLTTFYFMLCWQAARKELELSRKVEAYMRNEHDSQEALNDDP